MPHPLSSTHPTSIVVSCVLCLPLAFPSILSLSQLQHLGDFDDCIHTHISAAPTRFTVLLFWHSKHNSHQLTTTVFVLFFSVFPLCFLLCLLHLLHFASHSVPFFCSSLALLSHIRFIDGVAFTPKGTTIHALAFEAVVFGNDGKPIGTLTTCLLKWQLQQCHIQKDAYRDIHWCHVVAIQQTALWHSADSFTVCLPYYVGYYYAIITIIGGVQTVWPRYTCPFRSVSNIICKLELYAPIVTVL